MDAVIVLLVLFGIVGWVFWLKTRSQLKRRNAMFAAVTIPILTLLKKEETQYVLRSQVTFKEIEKALQEFMELYRRRD